MIGRRQLLKTAVCHGLASQIDETRRDQTRPQIYPNMIGCVGRSKHPEVTADLLQALSFCAARHFSLLPIDRSPSVPRDPCFSKPVCSISDGVKAVYYGTMPEFPHYRGLTAKPFANEADLLLHTYQKFSDRLDGIKEFFSIINCGDYAAVVAEKDVLRLFCDGVKLHVVDLRETLGQIFFVPCTSILRDAVDKTLEPFVSENTTIIEMPDSQIWILQEMTGEWNIRKFKVTKTKYIQERT